MVKVKSTLDVQVLAVRPSRCEVTTAYTIRNAAVLSANPVTAVPAVDLAAGRAHYGDYFQMFSDGTATTEAEVAEWVRRAGPRNAPANERYERATVEMKRAFPNLASLPTEDRDSNPSDVARLAR